MGDSVEKPVFNALDRRVARLVAGRCSKNREVVELVVSLVSYQLRQGHVCLDLYSDPPAEVEPFLPDGLWPALPGFLPECPVVSDEDPGDQPLILSRKGKLYFHRYWHYERELLQAVTDRCGGLSEEDRKSVVKSAEAGQTGFALSGEQQDAVATAMRSRLTLISGGPGTGKTSTIASLIVQSSATMEDVESSIALAAPTGKAAQRMQQSLEKGLMTMDVKPLNIQATTVHRLLGYKRFSSQFRHDQKHPLPFQLVIIDEASMLDLPLFAKLILAVAPEARLVLLGDRHQLSSVEAGSIFGDLVEAGTCYYPLQNRTIDLRKNFRFPEDSLLHRLCQSVKLGEADRAAQLIETENSEVHFMPLPPPQGLKQELGNALLAHYAQLHSERDPGAALDLLGKRCLLSPNRKGPYGVEELNRTMESLLALRHPSMWEGRHYHGKPILITENSYDLNLFNGEIGVFLSSPNQPDQLRAWFYGDSSGEVRKYPISALPAFETAYALTVHKSQGSEYQKVYLILPPGKVSVLTRELLYTALSRSRKTVHIWANLPIFKFAIRRPTRRSSGIVDRLSALGLADG